MTRTGTRTSSRTTGATDKTQHKSLPSKSQTKASVTVTEQVKVMLAEVPSIKAHSEYIRRDFAGHDDYDVFDHARKAKTNVLIEGPTGSGKTSGVMAYAAYRKYRFGSVSSSVGLDPSQLFGRFVPDGKGSFVWVDGLVTDLVRNGGVLLLNEVNFIPERVSTVLFSLLDKRRVIQLQDHHGEVVKAHGPDCWCDLSEKECEARWLLVVADMNPSYEGTRPLNKAFRNRFGIQLEYGYSDEIEKRLVYSDQLREMVSQFRKQAAAGKFSTPISTNMMMEFERLADDLGVNFAVLNFVGHFQPGERDAAKVVCNTWSANIEADLVQRAQQSGTSSGDDEDEFPADEYGITWVYEDEDINEVRKEMGIEVDED